MSAGYIRQVFLRRPLPPGSYLGALPAVRHLTGGVTLDFSHDVTFLVGENGTGKSTLLEAIAVACGFNAEGGSRNFNFSTRATHSVLGNCLTVVRSRYPRDGFFLRAESFYNVATNLEALDEGSGDLLQHYGGVSLHHQSHGESFLALVQNRFGGEGLYLLDEPEAALSPARQLTLMAQIHLLVEQGAQFVIATHSPILMAYPQACVYELSEQGIAQVDYRQTEHYCLTRRFLEQPQTFFRTLFSGEEPVK